MKALKYLDDELVIRRGIDALVKELGSVEATRFLSFPKEKRIESVKRHREWQSRLDKEAFFAEIFSS